MLKEICNECGRSVNLGTGLFVNRVIDFNEVKDRVLMQKPFPEGDFICPLCEENEQGYKKNYAGNQRISN